MGLIGAAGYCGLMVWHGGISGSSLIKIAEPGHLATLVSPQYQYQGPHLIDFKSTVFSLSNLIITAILFLVLPLTILHWKKVQTQIPDEYNSIKNVVNKKLLVPKDSIILKLQENNWRIAAYSMYLFSYISP